MILYETFYKYVLRIRNILKKRRYQKYEMKENHLLFYIFDFKNGKICCLTVSGTLVVFNGGVTAACINLEYT